MAGASATSITVNLVKTIIGAGMLALPYAYRAQGVLLATATILIAGLTTFLGAAMQAYAAGFVPKGEASYFSVSKLTYPSVAVLFDVAIAVKCFGVGVSYLVITGNMMPMIAAYFGAQEDSIFQSRMFWLILSMCVVGPLSYLRSLQSLRYASIVGLFSAVYLVAIVVCHFFAGDTVEYRGEISWVAPESLSAVIRSLPIIIFAFTCGHNVFSALNEAGFSAISTAIEVLATCLGASGAIYLLVGTTGYLSFGNNVGDNIIMMYPQSVLTTLGRCAIVVLVVLSFPLLSHPCRASVCNIISVITGTDKSGPERAALLNDNTPPQSEVVTPAVSQREHILVTTAILIGSFFLAASVESLELVLSFVGATGATAISFILPGVFAYSLATSPLENRLVTLTLAQKRVVRYLGAGLFIWGCVIMVVCLGSNLSRLTASEL